MHVEESTHASVMKSLDAKRSASYENEDDEILQLKKALLIDNPIDSAPSEKSLAQMPNFGMESRSVAASQMLAASTQLSSLPLSNFYPYANAMSNIQSYQGYGLRPTGPPNFKPPEMPTNFQAPPLNNNLNRPASRFDHPQGINYSGIQQVPLQRPPHVPPHLGQYTMAARPGSPLVAYALANGAMASGPMPVRNSGSSDAYSNLPAHGTGHNDARIAARKNSNSGNNQVAPVALPKDTEQETQTNFLIFDDKLFREGDFVILKANPRLSSIKEGIVVQIVKFLTSKPGHFQGIHFIQPKYLDLETPKEFHRQELVRLVAKCKYTLADFEARCQVLSEDQFKIASQEHQPQPIFFVRFRYYEKKRVVFKIKNLSAVLNINQLTPPETTKPTEFKVPAPPGCPNVVRQPEVFSFGRHYPPKVATTPLKAINYRLKRKDADYIDSLKNEYPCDQDKNLLWFNTPPIYPTKKTQGVGHSLDFLVHLAKKRKAKMA
ncbi:hypothetical protein DSO57_1023493 [Entomophthora muscae]|uniref:Uncharacterized protein n=1 Tax=Entomophthora muscae TaxID=34485 RepID=A0ACC2U0V3_9FUNG|nr:hypothetical protein DSO57_1023493 [Entomophthora muscae]